MAYSLDGMHWGVESFGEKYAFTSVAWSKPLQKFVAVGHGGLIYTGTFNGNSIAVQGGNTNPGKGSPERATVAEQVNATIAMKKAFQLRRVKPVCGKDLNQYCQNVTDANKVTCLQNNQGRLSERCEQLLQQEVGTKPTTEIIEYQGVKIPVGSTLFMNRNGGIRQAWTTKAFLYKNISFEAGKIYFGNEIVFPRFTDLQIINGVVYRPPSISFFPSGKIRGGILYEDTEIKGRIYKADTGIQFYGSGKVEYGVIKQDYAINGKLYSAGRSMKFEQDGSVAYSIEPKYGDFTQPWPKEGGHF